MTIQVGERLPEGTLSESTGFDTGTGCPLKPQPLQVAELAQGKKIVVFGLPGAFTPTCSAQHVPGYLAHYDELKAKGVDEIWCVAVNDGFVMGAWGQQLGVDGKVRMLADGSAEYTRKLGLELDLTAKGMGVRCQRFAMVVDDGVVGHIAVEEPGKFEVSSAEAVLAGL
ncbi:Peroxiredoxin [Methylomagnum ishizawai]|uniref:Glutathione-dependent peroxiredoxin n=1 Tax=Methylomagnum ishizawai TaxID=1760988 RepID=A0A1Y6DAY0_9GAMM|nr:peroxiredoxin [Methylomagnum ishizawai]SMF97773.1 Peroxiredoxin [Methylomagnum ishizawai]